MTGNVVRQQEGSRDTTLLFETMSQPQLAG
jgi:hypothetical protein